MTTEPESKPARRRFLMALLALPVVYAAGVRLRLIDDFAAAEALLAAASPKGKSKLTPTPECGDDDDPTPSSIEGPFFTPRSPKRNSLLERDLAGTRLVLTGRVFSRKCRPVAGALLDFWHADDAGEYDNEGYRLRGHQFTDAQGRYRLETIVPGVYEGRTRHFHVKVQAPRGRVLTTQLYFPGESANRSDYFFRSDLLMAVRGSADPKDAHFNFVLET